MDSTMRASVTAPSMAPVGRWALLLLASLFLAATGGAWAWFHVSPPVPEFSHEFVPKPTLQGTQFQAIPVSAQAMETLANTNLLNGQFKFDRGGGEYTVFFADWRARSAREMNVVQHTPDICWVGAGWTAVDLNLPSKVELTFEGRKIPFECRAFRAPRSQHQELTLWCTLVSGQVFDEGERFESERAGPKDARVRQASANRRRGFEQFSQVVRQRIAGNGSKQFVRFSTEIRGDPAQTIQDLVGFGQKWLELKTTRGAAPLADAH